MSGRHAAAALSSIICLYESALATSYAFLSETSRVRVGPAGRYLVSYQRTPDRFIYTVVDTYEQSQTWGENYCIVKNR